MKKFKLSNIAKQLNFKFAINISNPFNLTKNKNSSKSKYFEQHDKRKSSLKWRKFMARAYKRLLPLKLGSPIYNIVKKPEIQ